MKTKPILFNAEMVRAILDGRKTQTRRVVKPQPPSSCGRVLYHPKPAEIWMFQNHENIICPYGAPGDELWVKETMISDGDDWWNYAADGGSRDFPLNDDETEYADYVLDWMDKQRKKQRTIVPSIHMPRWASRITLRITDVRVERVQDITDADALAEGIKPSDVAARGYQRGYQDARVAFRVLWNSINEKRGFGWEKNSWVWVVEFEVVK
jgi:hypothetical protein